MYILRAAALVLAAILFLMLPKAFGELVNYMVVGQIEQLDRARALAGEKPDPTKCMPRPESGAEVLRAQLNGVKLCD
jgi:hypothetical protein